MAAMLAQRLALLCAVATFVLLLIGGSVNPTQSSLACEVGLTCQGQFIPDAQAWQVHGVLYEHGHRLAAMTVGLIQIALTWALWAGRRRLWSGAVLWGSLTLAMVLVQGGLGQLTVHYQLPWFVSTAHFLLGMTYLGCLLYIAARVRDVIAPDVGTAGRWLGPVVALLATQLMVGALVRHHGAAMACPNLLTCDGALWPSTNLAQLQMVHRGLGLTVGLALLAVAWQLRHHRPLRPWLAAGAGLVIAQIALGFSVIYFGRAPWVAVAHFAGGASLWTVWLTLWLRSEPTPDGGRTSTLGVRTRSQVGQSAAAAVGQPGPQRSGPLRLAREYVSLSKPRITAMSVLTALAGYALAPGEVAWGTFAWLALGTALVVGSANALNMVWERDIDGKMARTRHRPLPTGRLQPQAALVFGVLLGVGSMPVLWHVAPRVAALGALALAIYVLAYTPMKPVSHWATWVGAVPGAAPMLMGWAASEAAVDARAFAVFAILFVWQMPHFWAISLFRQEEYTAAGLQTLPAARGVRAVEWQIPLMLVVQVAASLLLPFVGIVGAGYVVVALIAGAFVLSGALRGQLDAPAWGRRVFYRSLIYLPLVCAAMLLDKRL